MLNSYTAILDYDCGNTESIQNALRAVGQNSIITNDKFQIKNASSLILPGVGAFPVAMNKLREKDLEEPIRAFIDSGRPLMGICLGMQILMESGTEFTDTTGINVFAGKVISLKGLLDSNSNRRVPNIGWYKVNIVNKTLLKNLFSGIFQDDFFYFVHSFVCQPLDLDSVMGTTNFGPTSFCSAFAKENVFGVQFHPEKSGRAGLKVLKNFIELGI
jgi:glutamine amidotransferase